MVAAIAAVLGPHASAGLPGERLARLRRNDRPGAIDRFPGKLCVSSGLIADGLQFGDSVLEDRVGEVGGAVLDRVVKTLELGFRFRAIASG